MKIIIYTKEKVYNFLSYYDKDYDYALRHAHREDGPAVISYFNNGNIKCKVWLINGKRHREDGSAIIWYYKNGNKERENWYINGKLYVKPKFDKEILKKKLKLM